MDPDIAWEYTKPDFLFDDDTVCFTIFYLHPYHTDVLGKLSKLFDQLTIQLDPYIKHYPWLNAVPKMILEKKDNYHYIYGELNYQDAFEDAWLLLQVLIKFTSRDDNLYLHAFDQNGEILLIELHDEIPRWLNSSNGGNRCWINNRQVLVIPESYEPNEGLKLKDSLEFLLNFPFKCLKLELPSIISEFPKRALQLIHTQKALVDNKTCSLIISNLSPSQMAQAINEYSKLHPHPSFLPASNGVDKPETIYIQLPYLLSTYLDFSTNSFDEDVALEKKGWILQQSIQSYLNEHNLNFQEKEISEHELVKHNETILQDPLQSELKRLEIISHHVKPKHIELTQDGEDDAWIEEFREVFSNLNRQSHSTNTVNDEKEHDNAEGPILSGEREAAEKNEDSITREYLKEQNIDIDEDDFFEFFCKEALKMDDKAMETLINYQPEHDIEDEDFSDDEDEKIDSEQFKLIQNLLRSMKH
ncbi:BA75_04886T0 [Komagataella pastoris]|uniref:BA75_04886T0 n=1 Tax=Komagataella pastoris TaxID=4922 RepID=A0A1B2JI66_PICPA|nr:BA75_04886T0 [Komagataella pastoris]